MYSSFFGLTEKPFAITPDPRYLYLSERHAEALAHLAYGITEAGGFIQLTGEIGTGKTTVLRSLLQQLPAQCDVALILNPRVTPAEFLQGICDELHLHVPPATAGSVKALVDLLTQFLLDAHGRGRRIVLMVDEAQNLSPDVLEQVRLLTNLETATQKLLQIILIGQPELREVLGRPDLRQLAQRITGRYHLEALRRNETIAYVRHRLRVAGATTDVFSPGALVELHRLAGGVPRIINVVADRALLGAYTREEHRVSAALVRRAAAEVYGRPVMPRWMQWLAAASAVAGVVLLGFTLWQAAPEIPAPAAAVEPPTEVITKTPPPAPPPPAPTLGELLAAAGPQSAEPIALAALARLWGIETDALAEDACEQLAARGLQCVSQPGSLAQLKQLNRPALLSLVDASGAAHHVILRSLGSEQVALQIGEAQVSVPVGQLAEVWFGDALLMWRPPATPLRVLKAGMQGEDVRWLRQRLARLTSATDAESGSDTFDTVLTQTVRAFQHSQRLDVDGVAGLQTQLALDAAVPADGTPTLQAGPP